jgi:hypothetical protein
LGRDHSLLILGKIITKIANLGSKKAGVSLDFWENCMILKTGGDPDLMNDSDLTILNHKSSNCSNTKRNINVV